MELNKDTFRSIVLNKVKEVFEKDQYASPMLLMLIKDNIIAQPANVFPNKDIASRMMKEMVKHYKPTCIAFISESWTLETSADEGKELARKLYEENRSISEQAHSKEIVLVVIEDPHTHEQYHYPIHRITDDKAILLKPIKFIESELKSVEGRLVNFYDIH